jgi:hypothetical protein
MVSMNDLNHGLWAKKDTSGLPFYLMQEMIVIVNGDKEGHEKIQSAVKSFLNTRR